MAACNVVETARCVAWPIYDEALRLYGFRLLHIFNLGILETKKEIAKYVFIQGRFPTSYTRKRNLRFDAGLSLKFQKFGVNCQIFPGGKLASFVKGRSLVFSDIDFNRIVGRLPLDLLDQTKYQRRWTDCLLHPTTFTIRVFSVTYNPQTSRLRYYTAELNGYQLLSYDVPCVLTQFQLRAEMYSGPIQFEARLLVGPNHVLFLQKSIFSRSMQFTRFTFEGDNCICGVIELPDTRFVSEVRVVNPCCVTLIIRY